jgi:hypothetical protein
MIPPLPLPGRLPVEHELRTGPDAFANIDSGAQRVDLRRADRDYRVGDTLWLREWDRHLRTVDHDAQVEIIGGYTGRECRRVITHVQPGGRWGLSLGWVALSLGEGASFMPAVRIGFGEDEGGPR